MKSRAWLGNPRGVSVISRKTIIKWFLGLQFSQSVSIVFLYSSIVHKWYELTVIALTMFLGTLAITTTFLYGMAKTKKTIK